MPFAFSTGAIMHRFKLEWISLALFAGVSACGPRATTAPTAATRGTRWFATWAAANYEIVRPPADSIVDRRPVYANRTVRQIVHTSVGGNSIRVRFTNEYGNQPLVIGAAHVALRDTGSAITPSTDHAITFGGQPSIVMRPGALIVSDPIPLAVPQLSDLAITMLVRDSIRVITRHALGLQSNYVARGDYVSAATMPVDTTISAWLWLAGVDVVNPAITGTIVTIGNSITDGAQSTRNTNSRWPDVLARRLLASSEPAKGIANVGISGNRVLSPGTGPSALARFDRDVLAQPGATHVIVLEGINDIGSSIPNRISADDIIYGLHQLADRAHEHGLVIFGATLTPAGPRAPYTPELEAKRVAVNAWIRSSGVFDGVIDFDAATRDPADPKQMQKAYDSGDHLHPGDAGYKAMGDAIDLTLFRRTRP
jgi:lysophospholipase L1-like esterase